MLNIISLIDDQQELDELKNEIDSYSPPRGIGVKHANILFLGPIGAGKSSFFNTIASTFRGHVTGQAISGSAEHSVTSKVSLYMHFLMSPQLFRCVFSKLIF